MTGNYLNVYNCQKNKNSSMIYIVASFLFLLLFVLRDILHINISYYLISVAAMAIIFILPQAQISAFVLSVYIFANSGFSGAFVATVFMAVLIRFAYCLKRISIPFLIIIILLTFEMLHIFSSASATMSEYIILLIGYLTFAILIQFPSNKMDLLFLQKSFCAFAVFFVAMSFAQMFMAYGSISGVIQHGMRTDEYQDLVDGSEVLMANQNYLTVLCSTGLGISALLLSHAKRKLPYIVVFAIFIFVGLLTVSKMFMGILAVFAIYTIYASFRKGIKYGLFIVALLVTAAWFVYNLFDDTLIAMVKERFQTGSLTTGRLDIVESLLVHMDENPYLYFCGTGMVALKYVMIEMCGKVVHSSVFEVLGAWGIPGLVLTVALIASLARKVTRENETKFALNIQALPLVIVLVYSVAGMLFSEISAVARLVACIYALGIHRTKEKQSD